MATEERHPGSVLDPRIRAVLDDASRTSFFALVATLERLSPGAVRVGGDGPVSAEAIRFRNEPSMGFAASDVSGATLVEAGRGALGKRELIEVTTTFLGLTGSVSPLPLHIPAEVAQETSARNVQRDFLDIFHHRLISLLYRLWTRYQIAREHLSGGGDAWTPRILALGGFDAYAPGAALPLSPLELARLTPLLVWRARPARSLALIVGSALREDLADGVVRIEQLTGGDVEIDAAQRMRLGTGTSVLGRTAILGARLRDRPSGFTIGLSLRGDCDATAYMDGGERLALVRALVLGVLREPLDFDLSVEQEPSASGGFALDGRTGLGRNTWLSGRGAAQRFTVRGVVSRESRASFEERNHHAS